MHGPVDLRSCRYSAAAAALCQQMITDIARTLRQASALLSQLNATLQQAADVTQHLHILVLQHTRQVNPHFVGSPLPPPPPTRFPRYLNHSVTPSPSSSSSDRPPPRCRRQLSPSQEHTDSDPTPPPKRWPKRHFPAAAGRNWHEWS